MVSSKRLAEARRARRELAAASAAAGCNKAVYADQAAARIALASLQEKRLESAPVGVYACDICTGWHLTSKNSGRKVAPWDRNPDWTRPSAH